MTLSQAILPPNIGEFENLSWLVEVTSGEEFSLMMEGRDIPIDSNVFLYSGNISRVLTIQDVYRPAPHFQLRQGVRHSLNPSVEPSRLKLKSKLSVMTDSWRFTTCAVWAESLGLEASPQNKLELRTDLTGVVMRATSETEPPFSQTQPAGEVT